MTTLILIFAGLLGSIFGSFISVLNHRTEHNLKGIFAGRSMCPHCKHKLGLLDLIPIFSFLFLRGKCRYCKKKISKQYFYLELITATVFVITTLNLLIFAEKSWTELAFWLVIFSTSIAISAYDLKTQLIPSIYNYSLIGISLLGSYFILGNSWQHIAMGGSIGFGFFFLQYLVSKGKWTGLGDADLGGVIGIIMGPVYGIQTIFCAYLMGSIYGVGLLTTGKAKRDSRIAFGPFLLFALFINVLFWDKIMQILTLNF